MKTVYLIRGVYEQDLSLTYQTNPFHQQQKDNVSRYDMIYVCWKLFTTQLNDQDSTHLNKSHYHILRVSDYDILNYDIDSITIIF